MKSASPSLKQTLQRIAFPTVVVLITAGLGVMWWKTTWYSIPPSDGIGIHLVIANETTQKIGPFVVGDELSSTSMRIPTVEPHSSTSIDFVTPEVWGENSIVMSDLHGNRYIVVGYFEHSIRGRVDIVVECANTMGLSGRYRAITSYFRSMEWRPWGIRDCELPSP
jgi:hypothetical protein